VYHSQAHRATPFFPSCLHALLRLQSHITTCNSVEEMVATIQNVGGFARIPFHSMDMDGKEGDARVHELCGGEVRGFAPSEVPPPEGTRCIITGKPAKVWAYVARAY